MNIKISDLYETCDKISKDLGLTVNDRFAFDLSDETSVDSIKKTFAGIEDILLPENGRYLVLLVSNEKPDILTAVFPETEDSKLKINFFNLKDKSTLDVTGDLDDEEDPITLDNFHDYLTKGAVEEKVNKFLFSGEEAPADTGDAGAASEEPPADDGEPTDDEGAEGTEDGDDEGDIEVTDDEEDDTGDDVEVDDAEAGTEGGDGEEIEVTDDEGEGEGDDAGEPSDGDGEAADDDIEVQDETDPDKPEVIGEKRKINEADEPAAAPVPIPPATGTPVDPAAAVPETTDPQADVRALISHYTDMLKTTANDGTASTEVVGAINDIIASLVSNLESINKLKEVQDDAAKDAAKAIKKNNPGEVSEDGAPPTVEHEETAGLKNVEVPIDQDVQLSSAFNADTLAGDVETPAQAAMNKVSDVPSDAANEPAVGTEPGAEDAAKDDLGDITIDIADPAAPVVSDAPVSTDGEPLATPGDIEKIDLELKGDRALFGPDGLPVGGETDDNYVDDQLARLGADKEPVGQGMEVDAVAFAPDSNLIKWSDSLYSDGKPNSIDNDKTIPAALKELKEYSRRMQECVQECSVGTTNQMALSRINKFCNLCATAFDTWHKIQESISEDSALCEAFNRDGVTPVEEMGEQMNDMQKPVDQVSESIELRDLRDTAKEFQEVQNYINSIKKYL